MSCYNSTVLQATADEVWQAVRDFHDMSWAEGVVTDLQKVGDAAGDQPGAGRVLNGVFHETLIAIDDDARTFRYSIDDGPGTPVAKDKVKNYVGTVRVLPVTTNGTTFFEWTSSYETDDEAAVGELCNPIYQALLGCLQAKFG